MPAGASEVVTFAVALGAGVAGHLIAHQLRTPAIVPLLALGVALGPDGFGVVDPRALGDGLLAIVSSMRIGVTCCLFTSMVMLPALLTWWSWRRPLQEPGEELAERLAQRKASGRLVRRDEAHGLSLPRSAPVTHGIPVPGEAAPTRRENPVHFD